MKRRPIRLDPEAFPEQEFRVTVACLTDLLAEVEERARAARLALDDVRDADTSRSSRELTALGIEIDGDIEAVVSRCDGMFRKITHAVQRAGVPS